MLSAAENYNSQLDIAGNGIIGYVIIPKIQVNLPIYHGTDAEVLDRGVGHLLGSSLPVGGKNTHTILSGHSGMASQKMFTDLEQLVPGDVFYLNIRGETMAYQVTEINTVLPYETDLLGIVPGEDLCTLVTCTPYGINTHRLLVRGSRIPYEEAAVMEEETASVEPAASTWEAKYLQGLLVGGGAAGIAGLLMLAATRIWKKHPRHRKDTNKQFLTIETRSGEVFYIIIDYDAPVNENLEQFSAYFLNKVDNADLSALLDDGNTVEVCGCIDRCYAGHVNTTCPICAKNMTECVGKEPETTEAPTTASTEPVKEPEKKSNPVGLLLVLLILGMGGAVAWHFFKNKMPDPQTKGDTDLDDYDYGIDEDLDYDTEDEQEEQH